MLENAYTYLKGHPLNPFSEQDFIDKFRLCVPYSVLPLPDAVVDRMTHDILQLERFDNVVPVLIDPLVP
ncbi:MULTISPECIES: MmgE/PrpD family protein [unclassified Pseudomonas]|uniref:MmgE/PrpD family protein n=1 Tax=unclassified Pseudomonas TaxID=196821 RepID=UPI00111C7CB4|nr:MULTISPECIES: MmgE/PrpD family protein [unclassified Pseudomonas]